VRLIDPKKTKTEYEKTEYGFIENTHHFNGSKDANVRIAALVIKPFEGRPDKNHVAAIIELEEATKEHRLAKESNAKEWLRYTTSRLRAANERIREVQ